MTFIEKGRPIWLSMLLVVLAGNVMLYQTQLGMSIIPEETKGVVLGSLFDLIIMLPLFFMLTMRKFSVKTAVLVTAFGCILARFIIPSSMLEPYVAVTWIGIVVEVAFVAFEVLLILTFVRYIPKILAAVKSSNLPVIFSFHEAVEQHVTKNPIIKVLCSELFMLYYALFAWKKKAPQGITLHKNSSYIAFMIMIIHAIVIETLGIHWWLHDKSAIVSIILLVLNVYSIFFFLGDINAVRLNPIYFTHDSMYISFGLMKRAKIDYSNIEVIIEDRKQLEKKIKKDTLDFIANDFETAQPQMILKMKTPVTATLFMGIEKQYSKVAIRCDQPELLKERLERGMMKA